MPTMDEITDATATGRAVVRAADAAAARSVLGAASTALATTSAPGLAPSALITKVNGLPDGATLEVILDAKAAQADLVATNAALSLISPQASFFNRAVAAATVVPGTYTSLAVAFHTSPGDDGGAEFKRVDAQPTHSARLRTTDRFLADGVTIDATNGGWWEVTSPVLKPEMVGNPAIFATGAGTAIEAITNASIALGRPVEFGPRDYFINKNLVFNGKFEWRFNNPRLIQGTYGAGPFGYVVCTIQPAAGKYVTGQGNLLAADLAAGEPTRQVTLVAGKGANFTVGSWVHLRSNAKVPGAAVLISTQCEAFRIDDIAGDVLTLSGVPVFSYTTAQGAEVFNVNLVQGVKISGTGEMVFATDRYVEDTGPYNTGSGINLVGCLEAEIAGTITFRNFRGPAIVLEGSMHCVVTRPKGYDGNSISFTPVPGYSYLVCENGFNHANHIVESYGNRVRHVYTTGESKDKIGVPMFTKIDDLYGVDCNGSPADTHEAGYGQIFNRPVAVRSRFCGIAIRSVKATINSPVCTDCIGPGVSFSLGFDHVMNDAVVERCGFGTINGVQYKEWGAVHDSCHGTTIAGLLARDNGGQAYQKTANNFNTSAVAYLSDITAIRNGRAAPSKSFIVGVQDAGLSGDLHIDGLIIDQTGVPNTVAVGLRQTNGNVRLNAQNVFIKPVGLTNALQIGTNDVVRGGNGPWNQGRQPTLIVNLGAADTTLTVLNGSTDSFDFRPSTGVAHVITQILGGAVGQEIEICMGLANGGSISLTHSNNIFLSSQANKSMIANARAKIVFRNLGSGVWGQVGGY